MSGIKEFKANKFSIGIPDVVMSAALPAAGAAGGAFITNGLINSLTYITHFSVDGEATKWAVAAGALAGAVGNIALTIRNNDSSIDKTVKSTLSALTFAGLAYVSFGTNLFNDKARNEPVNFDFERFTCFAEEEKGQVCKYVDGKFMIVDEKGEMMDPQPNYFVDNPAPVPTPQ